MRVAPCTTWLFVKMKPSGVMTNPEPFPAMPSGLFLLRCWTSMFTTEGATRSTALTTAREYSSRSAVSAAPVAVSLREECSGWASLSKSSGRAAGSKFVVVISKISIDQSIRQLQVDLIYTGHLECCSPVVLGLKESMAKTASPPSVLELQCAIGGISQKMLTQTLRSLERDGLVRRIVHPVVPPKVEYSLTRLGRTLIEPLHALCRWSEKHLAELQSNRARAKAVAAPSAGAD